MTLINDPDNLNQGLEVTIDPVAETVTLSIAGNLSNDGVTGSAKYSFLKEEWRLDTSLIPTEFPMLAIDNDAGKFAIGQNSAGFNNWAWGNEQTRTLLRSMGWEEYNATGARERAYIGVFSGDGVEVTSQPYYAFSSDTAPTDFDFTGPIDQGVQYFGDASNGNFDRSAETLTIYVREQGRTYSSQTTTALPQLASELKPIFAPLTLSEDVDIKISAPDVNIDSQAPYTGMSITYGPVQRNIGGTNYNFGVVIDGNSGTAEQIYEFVQRQLRRDADIDAGPGSKNGKLADELLAFVGDRLDTLLTSDGGVFIDNFDSNDTNRIRFADDTGAFRTFPFVSAGTLNFNANLQNDPDSIYRMFFSSLPGAGNDFGEAGGVLVNDNAGVPISGNVGGAASISFDFDYDGNTQGGRTPGQDAAVTIVAQGLNGAQWTVAEGTITRATGLNFTLSSPLERNYSNPV